MGLTLRIENYRAVKHAEIELAGLTVLAGVNAAGKSTIARTFHMMVEGGRNRMQQYIRYLFTKECVDVYMPFKKFLITVKDLENYRSLMNTISVIGNCDGWQGSVWQTFISIFNSVIDQIETESSLLNKKRKLNVLARLFVPVFGDDCTDETVLKRLRDEIARRTELIRSKIQKAQSLSAASFWWNFDRDDGDSFQYNYTKLGTEIAPIYKVFNLALDQIAFYR